MSESVAYYTRTRGEITSEVLQELGFEQYQRKSSEWFYNGEMALYSKEHGSVRMRGLSCYIRKVADLKRIRDWIDMPSDKVRWSERQQRYYKPEIK